MNPETANIDQSTLASAAKSSFVRSAASAAGVIVGFLVVGYAKNKLDDRKAAKDNTETPEDE